MGKLVIDTDRLGVFIPLMSDADAGGVLMALYAYAETGEVPELEGMAAACFNTLRMDFEAEDRRKAERSNEMRRRVLCRWKRGVDDSSVDTDTDDTQVIHSNTDVIHSNTQVIHSNTQVIHSNTQVIHSMDADSEADRAPTPANISFLNDKQEEKTLLRESKEDGTEAGTPQSPPQSEVSLDEAGDVSDVGTRRLLSYQPDTKDAVVEQETEMLPAEVAQEPEKQKPKREKHKPPVYQNPPTLEEVEAYVREKGYTMNAAQCYDYYTANDWMQNGGKPIRDWMGAVRGWQSRENDYKHKALTTTTDNNRQQQGQQYGNNNYGTDNLQQHEDERRRTLEGYAAVAARFRARREGRPGEADIRDG